MAPVKKIAIYKHRLAVQVRIYSIQVIEVKRNILMLYMSDLSNLFIYVFAVFRSKGHINLSKILATGRHDTQHHDTRHKDIQHKDLICDIRHNKTVNTFRVIMLSVIF